ncbi:hypothetical protein NL676_025557 [Syzygium grande]|nr:hypothetical protein NL676_025557 [Syzygium grande]
MASSSNPWRNSWHSSTFFGGGRWEAQGHPARGSSSESFRDFIIKELNLPNVLQSTPVWARDYSSSEELITEFCRECRIVCKACFLSGAKFFSCSQKQNV